MESKPSLAGRKLQQVALTCRDLERSKAFYRDTLGLTFMFEASNMLFFQLDGIRLMIGKEMTPDTPIGGSVVYFDAPQDKTALVLPADQPFRWLLSINGVALLVLGLFWGPLIGWCYRALGL